MARCERDEGRRLRGVKPVGCRARDGAPFVDLEERVPQLRHGRANFDAGVIVQYIGLVALTPK